jgi:uncharacterized protein YkvS
MLIWKLQIRGKFGDLGLDEMTVLNYELQK